MAYDEALGDRIRAALANRDDVTERKMFGGIAFMIGDHMAVGVIHDDLTVRVGEDGNDEALSRPHTRPFDFSGNPMRGMVYVAPEGTTTDTDLNRWVQVAVAHAVSRPPKPPKSKRRSS